MHTFVSSIIVGHVPVLMLFIHNYIVREGEWERLPCRVSVQGKKGWIRVYVCQEKMEASEGVGCPVMS